MAQHLEPFLCVFVYTCVCVGGEGGGQPLNTPLSTAIFLLQNYAIGIWLSIFWNPISPFSTLLDEIPRISWFEWKALCKKIQLNTTTTSTISTLTTGLSQTPDMAVASLRPTSATLPVLVATVSWFQTLLKQIKHLVVVVDLCLVPP